MGRYIQDSLDILKFLFSPIEVPDFSMDLVNNKKEMAKLRERVKKELDECNLLHNLAFLYSPEVHRIFDTAAKDLDMHCFSLQQRFDPDGAKKLDDQMPRYFRKVRKGLEDMVEELPELYLNHFEEVWANIEDKVLLVEHKFFCTPELGYAESPQPFLSMQPLVMHINYCTKDLNKGAVQTVSPSLSLCALCLTISRLLNLWTP